MRYSGSYAVLLVLHLLTVAFVVGPAAAAAVVSARHARNGEAQALRAASRMTRLYTLGALVTILLGSAMIGLGDIGEQWEFGQLWVSASYALSIVAIAVVLGLLVPAQLQAAKAIEAATGGSRPDAARRAGTAFAGRISAGGGIAMLAWAAVIVLMVVKPGA